MLSTNFRTPFMDEFKRGFVTLEAENAKNEIMQCFREGILFWVYLFALMQSGKTDTYTLVACECVRRGLIDRIVILCASSELELKNDLQKKVDYFI